MDIASSNKYAAWMTAREIQVHASLKLDFHPDLGYNFVARSDIPVGELLLSVPLAATLNLDPTAAPEASELLKQGAPPLCASAVLLADALEAGEDGPLGQHAAILKSLAPVRNIPEWDRDVGGVHHELLRATSLVNTLPTMPLQQRFSTIVIPQLRGRPQVASALMSAAHRLGGAEGETFLQGALLRAATLIMSRCFHANGVRSSSSNNTSSGCGASESAPPVLVPVADFLNHHPTLAVTANARVGDAFHFYALRPVTSGSQVFLSYGPLSDAQLLHTYGFVPEEAMNGGEGVAGASSAASPSYSSGLLSLPDWNPHNTVTIPTGLVTGTLRALCAGGGRQRAGKSFDKVLATLKGTGLLPPASSGFVLQMSQEAVDAGGWEALVRGQASNNSGSSSSSSSSSGGNSLNSPSSSITRGRALEALIPPSLLTAVQLLSSGDPAAVAEYAAACKAASEPVLLSMPSPSTLLAKLNAPPSTADAAAAAAGSSSSSSSSYGNSAEDDEEEVEPDDVMETWMNTLAVLAAALRGYPTGLKQDAQWLQQVEQARRQKEAENKSTSSVGESTSSASDGSSLISNTGSRKRQRIDDAGSSSLSSSSSSSAGDDRDDPWSWPLSRQVAEGVSDPLYRACRLLAMREKQLLAAAVAAIDAELKQAQDEEGDNDGVDEDDETNGEGASDDDAEE